MRRMTSGKPDAVTPPVRFDEGRGWDQKLTTTVCLTLLSQSRLLYFVPSPIRVFGLNPHGLAGTGSGILHDCHAMNRQVPFSSR